MLYGIDRIVQGQNITVGRNLRMQRDQSPSGAVIMHDQIVNPGDIIIRENDVVNLLYQFRLGGLPKQGTDRVFGCDKSGYTEPYSTLPGSKIPGCQ